MNEVIDKRTINSAIYRGEHREMDVTDIVKNMTTNFVVNNTIFTDPEPDVIKHLIINDFIKITEGSVFLLDYFNKNIVSNRLGIFYTNNNININILNKVLYELSKSCGNIDIITCAWQKIDNSNFYNLEAIAKSSTHFNIVSQILQCLYLAKLYKKDYKYVSFLEHDVLYCPDHFMYSEFDENAICNLNCGGLNSNGYSNLKHPSMPLHQMTMKFEYAIEYFTKILLKYLEGEYNSVEPNTLIKQVHDLEQSVHIKHGANFTNHYDSYSEDYFNTHSFWKDYRI